MLRWYLFAVLLITCVLFDGLFILQVHTAVEWQPRNADVSCWNNTVFSVSVRHVHFSKDRRRRTLQGNITIHLSLNYSASSAKQFSRYCLLVIMNVHFNLCNQAATVNYKTTVLFSRDGARTEKQDSSVPVQSAAILCRALK